MPEPRLVVGLGNPGDEYEGTRHNLGFEVLDRLAERLGVRFERLKRKGLFSGKIKARVAVGALAEAGSDGAPEADVIVEGDPKSLLEFISGGLPRDEALRTGRVTIEGPPAARASLKRLFAGVG